MAKDPNNADEAGVNDSKAKTEAVKNQGASDPGKADEVEVKKPESEAKPVEHQEPNNPSKEDEAGIKDAEAELAQIQSEYILADEWGLFEANDHALISKELSSAGSALEGKKLIVAQDHMIAACRLINAAQRFKRGRIGLVFWYKLNNFWGLPPFLLTLGLTIGAYLLIFKCAKPMSVDVALQQPAFWGLIGAGTKSLYWLQQKNGTGALRPRFFSYFLVAPALGLCLGGALWLVVTVGFKLFAEKAQQAQPDWMVVALIAFFGGFNWEWALESVKAISNRVRSSWHSDSKPS